MSAWGQKKDWGEIANKVNAIQAASPPASTIRRPMCHVRTGYGAYGQHRGPPPCNQTMRYEPGRLLHEDPLDSEDGWLKTSPGDPRGYFPYENKDLIELPLRKGEGTNAYKKISIKVNHFGARITLPEKLYHYEVDLKWENTSEETERSSGENARKRNRDVRRYMRYNVLNFLITGVNQEGHKIKGFTGIKETYYRQSGGKSTGAVSDYSNALYTTERLEDHVPMTIRVPEEGPFPETKGNKNNNFILVTMHSTDEIIDTEAIQPYVNQKKGIVLQSTQHLKQIEKIYSTILKNLMIRRYTPVGRSSLILFEADGNPLGGGIVNYSGYNAILPICNGWKPYLNVDIANAATVMGKMVMEVVADVGSNYRTTYSVADMSDVSRIPKAVLQKASGVLRTCRVQYSPSPDKTLSGVVERVSELSVSQTMFEYTGAKGAGSSRISVYSYFKIKYGSILKYKDGIVVQLKGQKFVPAELCLVRKGQSYNRKLDADQTTRMLQYAKKFPNAVESTIQGAVQELDLRNNPVLKDFQISFDHNLLELKNTRVLAPPQLCFGKEVGKPAGSPRAMIHPHDGCWDVFGIGKPFEFQKTCTVKAWGVLNLSRIDSSAVSRFAAILKSKGPDVGIYLPDPHGLITENVKEDPSYHSKNLEAIKRQLVRFRNCMFVLVVIEKKGGMVYNQVKQAAELDIGIVTQCVTVKNVMDNIKLTSIASNLLLKVNSKLNGINYTIMPIPEMKASFQIMRHPVLIIGADVTHPPPGHIPKDDNSVQPSFAAVTGSIDRTGMPFMMHIQAQEKAGRGAAEVISGLDLIIEGFVGTFFERTGTRPSKIVYFRDGVGDGQFPEVLHVEMSAMRKACTRIQSGYEPKITVITVQKRHKTRFFYQAPGGKVDNAPPGTVVDTEIVHPSQNDFYLLSHRGTLGTSRPTRYHVLWDDSDFTLDELQTLAYYLCYMYVRCSKSVKIPAPTYYAHWAAARAKSLADGLRLQGSHTEQITAINKLLDKRLPFQQKFPMHFI